MPIVSILIPARRAEYLGRALISAQQQTFEDVEILVGDETPNADLEAIVRRLDDPRIRYFHHGVGDRGRNIRALWASARGAFVKWLRDEDLLMPESVARLVDALQAHPGSALAFHGRVFIDESDAVVHVPSPLLNAGACAGVERSLLVAEMVRPMHNFVGELSAVMVNRTRVNEDQLLSYRSYPLDFLTDVGLYLNLAEQAPLIAVGGYWSMVRRDGGQTARDAELAYSAGLYEWELFVRGEAAAGNLSRADIIDAATRLERRYAAHAAGRPEVARLLEHLDELTARSPATLWDSERFRGDLAAAKAAVASRIGGASSVVPTSAADLTAEVPTPTPTPTPTRARHVCVICEQNVDTWHRSAASADRGFLDALGAIDPESDSSSCPNCGSSAHERHLWLYVAFSRLLEQASALRILHLAPEARIESRIRKLAPLEYVVLDPFTGACDLEALELADNHFDLVICNHVLERVARPDAVLAELNRCLKTGGHLIAQTCYAPMLRRTLEGLTSLAPGLADAHFGRADRLRLFGADVADYFHMAGFGGDLRPHASMLGECDTAALGCDAREPFFLFAKQGLPARRPASAVLNAPAVHTGTGRATKPVRLVCATRSTQDAFLRDSPLACSLALQHHAPAPELLLYADNAIGLPTLYNAAIEQAASSPALLVFIHDDIWINDFFWVQHIREALGHFDVVGLAGNKRRAPGQVGWAFPTTEFRADDGYLSGAVAHGTDPGKAHVSRFGPSGVECKLLDGLFIAADSERLVESGVRFDERFAFHFYDMDFCRQVELKGLRMGTWPISVTHESGGAFDSALWHAGYESYLLKYGE